MNIEISVKCDAFQVLVPLRYFQVRCGEAAEPNLAIMNYLSRKPCEFFEAYLSPVLHGHW